MNSYIFHVRKNGKKTVIYRKLCEICHQEYMEEAGKKDTHYCGITFTKEDAYNEKCDQDFEGHENR